MDTEGTNTYTKRAIKYRELIDELSLDSPNETLIKTLMKEAGLKYIEDPIERLNLMLTTLHAAEVN